MNLENKAVQNIGEAVQNTVQPQVKPPSLASQVGEATRRVIAVYTEENDHIDRQDVPIEDVMLCVSKVSTLEEEYGLDEDTAIDFADWLEGGSDCHEAYTIDECFVQLTQWYNAEHLDTNRDFRNLSGLCEEWGETRNHQYLFPLLIRASKPWQDYWEKIYHWYNYQDLKETYSAHIVRWIGEMIMFG